MKGGQSGLNNLCLRSSRGMGRHYKCITAVEQTAYCLFIYLISLCLHVFRGTTSKTNCDLSGPWWARQWVQLTPFDDPPPHLHTPKKWSHTHGERPGGGLIYQKNNSPPQYDIVKCTPESKFTVEVHVPLLLGCKKYIYILTQYNNISDTPQNVHKSYRNSRIYTRYLKLYLLYVRFQYHDSEHAG